MPVQELLFLGTERSIVAVKVADGQLFREHVHRVRGLFLRGEIEKCIGWQVYQSYMSLPFGEKKIAGNYVLLEDDTRDFNAPEDLGKR
jgi:hypothetical protein